jgi:hypothetical protein
VFPVDPSEEELHVINFLKCPAFILGRSGTGKTTCLVYKLASRYLTSKAADELPVRQVSFQLYMYIGFLCLELVSSSDGSDDTITIQLLLTRSNELVQKLKRYTTRLINTRLGKIDSETPPEQDQSTTQDEDKEENTTKDLLSLKDEDFPLVCTFNHFLRLLENSIRSESIERNEDFYLCISTG